MTKALVIAPHPDDEVIGCGGAILKHRARGDAVTVVTLGCRMRSSVEADISEADYEMEQVRAHAALGVTGHVALGLPGRTTAVTHDLLMALVAIIRTERPEIFYVPHGGESDADHRRASEAALEAIWMAQSVYFEEHGPPLAPPRLILAYEVWTPISAFQYVEDISDVIDQKVAAMACYRSQLRHGPWDQAIRGLGAYRGLTARGGGYAEVFAVLHLGAAVAA